VNLWNEGKRQEFRERKTYNLGGFIEEVREVAEAELSGEVERVEASGGLSGVGEEELSTPG